MGLDRLLGLISSSKLEQRDCDESLIMVLKLKAGFQ